MPAGLGLVRKTMRFTNLAKNRWNALANSSFRAAKMLAPIIFLGTLLATVNLVQAEEEVIDFESLDSELKGWAAYGPDAGGQRVYRPAPRWETPFSFALDNETHHGGSCALKCEVSQDSNDVSFGPSVIPASGKVEIRFFVRTSGLGAQEGTLSIGEIDASGKSYKGYTSANIPSSDGDWSEGVWAGQLGPETVGVRLLFIYKPLPTGAKIWVDDISVKTVEN